MMMRLSFVVVCYFFLQQSEGLPVHTPRFNVTLYSERNSTGESNNFSGTSCQNLPHDHFNVSQVNGDCVRVYSKPKCQGRSIALHHHSSSPSEETFLGRRHFEGVTKSISPCFEGLGDKEIWIGPIPEKNVNVDSNVDSSIYNYQQGFKNRIEFVHAIIYNQDIDNQNNMKTIKSSVLKMVNRLNTDPNNYEIAPIIPIRLGGPISGTHNFFPKVKNLEKSPSFIWKVNQENEIFNILKDDVGMKFGEIFINFIYTTENSTIPLAFICQFVQPNGEIMIRKVINAV